MDVRAGIFWDPREPRPPGVAEGVDVSGVLAYREDRVHQWPHRPQPPRQPGLHGGRDEITIPQPQRNNLPPLSVSVTARVVQDTAKVTVTQLFWNSTNESIRKAAYTFPLSAGCTVTSFSCRFGRNKIIKAKVKPKPEARDAFSEALRTNRSAGLLEQATPEIFTTTLGNISAQTKLRTEITYITLLKHKFADNRNTTTLTVPTYIAPRYGRPPSELQNTAIPGISQSISIQVEVAAEATPHMISSMSHRITVERGSGRNLNENWAEFVTTDGANDVEVSLVKLEDGRAFLDRDFVLDIAREQQDGLETPTAWLETHPTLANHKAVMLTIPPNFMLRNQCNNPDGEIIFLADRSGSMSKKMKSLKSAMSFFLKGIPRGRRFNIWCFGSDHTSLWPISVEYSEEALQEAMAYVSEQFSSDMGGTAILRALKAIVGGRGPCLRVIDIVMLTDGEVWNLDETVSFVQDTSRSSEGRIRYFALGIGNAVSHELVEGIAKAGGGYAEVVPVATQAGWEDRVVAMLVAALAGHVRPLQIEFGGQDEGRVRGIYLQDAGNRGQGANGPTQGILQSPADISTLSPFLGNRAFMLFDSAREQLPLNHINIKVTTLGGEEIITRVPMFLVGWEDSTLHKLGARALLGDLERGQSWIHLYPGTPRRGSPEEQKLVRQEAEALGCKWSLVSKWTSFYAVEEPYHQAENARDPFLDEEENQIREGVGDLGLLRPRGVAAQQANLPAVPRPAAMRADDGSDDDGSDDDGSGDDEDTDFNSDHADTGSDSDDGGNDSDRGGAGGNQTGGSAGDQQSPEPGDSNADGDGGTMRRNLDTPDDATGPASHFAAFELGTRRIAREPLPVRSSDLDRLVQHIEDSFGILPTRRPSQAVPVIPLSFGTTPKKSSRIDVAFEPTERAQPKPSRHRPSSLKKERDLDNLGYDDRDSLAASSRASSPAHGHTSDSQSGNPALVSRTYSESTFTTDQAPYPDYSAYFWSPSAAGSENIIAPSFNMPASTAMRSNESRTTRSEQEIAGEQKIRNLLVFQSFDGSFNFDSAEHLRAHLGPGFASVVQDLQLQVDFKLAVTIGIMLLLEEKFEYCRDLWILVYDKATDYFKSQRPVEVQRDLLLESARLKVSALSMSQIMLPAAPAQLVVFPTAREQIPTQLSSSPTERSDDVKTEPRIGRLHVGSREESGAAVVNERSTKRVVLDIAPIED